VSNRGAGHLGASTPCKYVHGMIESEDGNGTVIMSRMVSSATQILWDEQWVDCPAPPTVVLQLAARLRHGRLRQLGLLRVVRPLVQADDRHRVSLRERRGLRVRRRRANHSAMRTHRGNIDSDVMYYPGQPCELCGGEESDSCERGLCVTEPTYPPAAECSTKKGNGVTSPSVTTFIDSGPPIIYMDEHEPDDERPLTEVIFSGQTKDDKVVTAGEPREHLSGDKFAELVTIAISPPTSSEVFSPLPKTVHQTLEEAQQFLLSVMPDYLLGTLNYARMLVATGNYEGKDERTLPTAGAMHFLVSADAIVLSVRLQQWSHRLESYAREQIESGDWCELSKEVDGQPSGKATLIARSRQAGLAGAMSMVKAWSRTGTNTTRAQVCDMPL